MSFIKDMMIKIEEDGFYCKDNKFVCFNCIGNEAIKKYIMENTEEHYCDYCKSQDTYAIHISTLLSLIMEAIKYEWTDANNEVFWDSSEGGWQGTEVIDTYDLIYDKYYDELNIDNINLINDILNSINKKSWCKINPYSLREHEEDYYTWELFCNQIKYETRYMFFKEDKNLTHYGYNYNQPYEILYKISKIIEKLNLILCQDNIYEFYRGRIHDEEKGFNTVLELATPKKEFIKRDNRMSPAHIPMFYGAFDANTVIEEIGGESKYISIGVFKNLKKLNLLDFTKIPALPSIFDKKIDI